MKENKLDKEVNDLVNSWVNGNIEHVRETLRKKPISFIGHFVEKAGDRDIYYIKIARFLQSIEDKDDEFVEF